MTVQLTSDQQTRLKSGGFNLPDRESLVKFVRQWNETRMDMFEIREPEENTVEFYGVVRFYHQDAQQRVSTKCIRVASSATTQDVIDILAQKFRPDMKMLTVPNYGLYEVHSNGQSRKLEVDERPIIVQLLWTQDLREGRLTLRNEDDPVPISSIKPATVASTTTHHQKQKSNDHYGHYSEDSDESDPHGPHSRNNHNSNHNSSNTPSTITKLTRKLTNRKKKRSAHAADLLRASIKTGNTPFNIENAVAHQMYQDKPESNFTRTISNPEAVLRRQREQKVRARLQKEARMIKIYGAAINDALPFVNLLVNPIATAKEVMEEALDKYSIDKSDSGKFLLVKLDLPPQFDDAYLSVHEEKLVQWTQVNEEPLQAHHRPLHLLMEHERMQRLKNSSQICAFQLRMRHDVVHDMRDNMDDSLQSSAEKQMDSRNLGPADLAQGHPSKIGLQRAETKIILPDLIPFNPNTTPVLLEYIQKGDRIIEHPLLQIGIPISIGCTDPDDHSTKQPTVNLAKKSDKLLRKHIICKVENLPANHNQPPSVLITPGSRNACVFINGEFLDTGRQVQLEHGYVIHLALDTSLIYLAPGQHLPKDTVRRLTRACQPEPENFEQVSAMLSERQRSKNSKKNRENRISFNANNMAENNNGVNEISEMATPESPVDHSGFQTGEYSPAKQQVPTSIQQPTDQGVVEIDIGMAGQDQPIHPPEPQSISSMTQLPAVVTFHFHQEELFLRSVFDQAERGAAQFRLAPAYSLYLAVRHVHTATLGIDDNAFRHFIEKIAKMFQEAVQRAAGLSGSLAFWMANSSEFLNFVRQDREVSQRIGNNEDILATTVQLAFRYLVVTETRELNDLMSAFLADTDVDIPIEGVDMESDVDKVTGMYDVIRLHAQAMHLLRRCRVNAALTIQLFSQLFHYSNMWLFNKLCYHREYCTRHWAWRFRLRLAKIESWAEKQGLELAADCHLMKVQQAVLLLQSNKQDAEDVTAIASNCFKLNSLQLRRLLESYSPDYDEEEPEIHPEIINQICEYTENSTDQQLIENGIKVELEESQDLQVPFLLPEDGYTCDQAQGAPNGLIEFLGTLNLHQDCCQFYTNHEVPPDQGWTEYFAYFQSQPVYRECFGFSEA